MTLRLSLVAADLCINICTHAPITGRNLPVQWLNQGMPIHALQKLLGYEHLNTTQIYARIYDQTLYRQFKEAKSHLEAS